MKRVEFSFKLSVMMFIAVNALSACGQNPWPEGVEDELRDRREKELLNGDGVKCFGRASRSPASDNYYKFTQSCGETAQSGQTVIEGDRAWHAFRCVVDDELIEYKIMKYRTATKYRARWWCEFAVVPPGQDVPVGQATFQG